MLRSFFQGINVASGRVFDDPDGWKTKVGVDIITEFKDGEIISSESVASYFAKTSYGAIFLDDFETRDDVSTTVLRSENMNTMLESFGLPDMPSLNEHQNAAQLTSTTYPIGWAVYNLDRGFGRHMIFEIGDEKNHIRLNLKDCWTGDEFIAQIDEITMWDKSMTYSIPCREYGFWIDVAQNIIGTIDITVQALCNEDDEQGYYAFQDIEALKEELLKVITPNKLYNLNSGNPAP